MRYRVAMTDPAAADLESICDYLADAAGPAVAERILDRMMAVIASLAESPERGARPRELELLGNRDFRQLHTGPWRVIYNLAGRNVYIVLIADGRRDMQTLLAQRLLGR
jgi:toxin ParE1/3/4